MTHTRKTCRVECSSLLSRDAIGYVTNQPGGLEKGRAHMSQVICGRPECRRRAEREVREFTGEEPLFCHFKMPDTP